MSRLSVLFPSSVSARKHSTFQLSLSQFTSIALMVSFDLSRPPYRRYEYDPLKPVAIRQGVRHA